MIGLMETVERVEREHETPARAHRSGADNEALLDILLSQIPVEDRHVIRCGMLFGLAPHVTHDQIIDAYNLALQSLPLPEYPRGGHA